VTSPSPKRSTAILAMLWPLLLTAAMAGVVAFLQANVSPQGRAGHDWMHVLAIIGLGIAVAWLIIRVVDVAIWRPMSDRTGLPPPRLLVELMRVFIALFIAALIATFVFDKKITGILVSSGVIGIVLGFALQRMISDFFSGIAMSVEGPFRVGQWIEVDGVAGQVVEINWRATRLVTLDSTTVIFPNSRLAEGRVVNFELPEAWFRTEMPVVLEHGVAVRDARRVILAAVRASEGVLDWPEPDVIVDSFGTEGVQYRARWYLRSYRDMNTARDRVATSISEHLYQAGLRVPYPKRDVFIARMPPRDIDRATRRHRLLERAPLFQALEPQEVAQLAAGLVERRVPAGQNIVQQGQAGESLFVAVEGLLEVKVNVDGIDRAVAKLQPGQTFGEMSLLTGEPRTATVTAVTDCILFELERPTLAPVMQNRPEIAQELTRLVVDRRQSTQDSLREAATRESGEAAGISFGSHVLTRIQKFFNL
jgi:small-conductance mechanosensitive channel